MAIWVDIEQSDSTRYGDGPVTSITSWTNRFGLDESGTFSFEFPAGNTRSGLCQAGRYARGWRVDDAGNIVEEGYGIIDHVSKRVSEAGEHMIVVSGVDLLGELGMRSVLDLAIETVLEPTSDRMVRYGGEGGWTTYTPASFPISLYFGYWFAEPHKLYVSHTESFEAVYFDLSAFTWKEDSKLHAEYYNSETTAWEQLNITTDGTQVDDVSLRQAGWIEFEPPALWGTTIVNGGAALYYVRFFTDVSHPFDDPVTFDDIQIRIRTPRDKAHVLESGVYDAIMDYAPAGWTVTAPTGVEQDQLEYFTDQTVLAALRKIAENTGDHFRRGTGRELVWIKKSDTPDTADVRALYLPDPTPALGNDDACLIVSLEEEVDTFRRITRLYPHGGGTGDDRPTLADCTRTPAVGYTLDTANNCIIHDASDAVARVDGVMSWSDIISLSASPTQREYASNQLYDRAYEYLSERHDVEQFYTIRVVKLNDAILPGDLLHVVAYVCPDTQEILDIDTVRDDAPFWVTDVEMTISADGTRITTLSVGTIDRRPDDDTTEIAHEIEQARIARAQNSSTSGAIWRWVSRGATGESAATATHEGGTNATMLQNRSIDAAAPGDMDALVWNDSLSLWTPTDIGLHEAGCFVWGTPDMRSLWLGDCINGLVGHDDQHRAFWRLNYRTDEYFAVGLPDKPPFYYDRDLGYIQAHGLTIIPYTILPDRLLLDSMQHNFMNYGELRMGDPSTYQTCEVTGLGLIAWGVTNQPPVTSDDVLNDLPGIRMQPVLYWPPDTYEYEESSEWKLAFAAYGPAMWCAGTGGGYSVANLTTLKTLAEYRAQGWQLWSNDDEMDSFSCYIDRTEGDGLQATIWYHEGGDDTSDIFMYWLPTGLLVTHNGIPALAINSNGVTIRDYLAFDTGSVTPGSPPVTAIWYDRTNDCLVYRDLSGNTRKVSNEAI